MGDELSTAYKMGTSAVVMALILSMGLTLMLIGRYTWSQVVDQVTEPVLSMEDNDAFYLASYDKPIPVADIWKLIARINYNASDAMSGENFSSFQIKERSNTNSSNWYLVSTSVTDLERYLARKAYLSWDTNSATGLYEMVVYLV